MTAFATPVIVHQFFDDAGNPLAGGKVYTYDSGTTTPKTTYTDKAGTVPNSNPIILDSAGCCNLWIGTGEYTIREETSSGALVRTRDHVTGVDSIGNLAADLADTTSASKGSGLVGFSVLLSYAAGTVGAALKSLFATVAALPWANLTGKPTTKAGYGIVDMPAYSDFLGLRNRLINGNFAIKQDATYSSGASVPAGGHIHDGWKAGGGGCTLTWATSGIDVVLTITAGTVVQVIDGADVEGGTYTLSQAGNAQARIDGGAYVAGSQTVTGKTAGTNIAVEYSTGTVSKVQFEPGSSATTFERTPFELLRCLRRYWVLAHAVFIPGSQAPGSGYNANQSVWFPVKMRATPTISSTFSGASNIGAQSVAASSGYGFTLNIVSAGVGNFQSTYSAGNTADARL